MSNEKVQAILTEGEIVEQWTNESKNLPRPTILVCGKTGTGKSTLLQSIFDKNIVGDDKIGVGRPVTQDFDAYENARIKIYDSKGLETDKGVDNFIGRLKDFIHEKASSGTENVADHIHCYWYLVDGGGVRIEDAELQIIDTFPKDSTIVIVSKSDRLTDPAVKESFEERLKGYKHIVYTSKPMDVEELRKNNPKTVESHKKRGMSDEEINEILLEDFQTDTGLVELVNLTEKMMPAGMKNAFALAQQIDLDKAKAAIRQLSSEADDIILVTAIAAGAAGAIPIPVADAAVITPAQIVMLRKLAGLYGVDIAEEQIMPLILAVAGKQAATGLLKFFPGIGSIISAGVAVTLTWGMGLYAKSHFEEIALARAEGKILEVGMEFSASGMETFVEINKALIESKGK